MQSDRRVFLRKTSIAGASALALMYGNECWASWEYGAFSHPETATAMEALLAGQSASRSTRVHLRAPAQHQHSALVPVAVTTTLSSVNAVTLLTDSRFAPLAATFHVGSRRINRIATRLRLDQSSRIWAVVKSDEHYFISDAAVSLVPFGSR